MIAISTAFKKALIGVEIDDKRGFKELDSNCKHSENILPSIDGVLNELGKELSDNDCYALVVGPGSFTGLRIGISLVKGFLAGGEKKDIISITTHELMAYTYIKNFKPKEDFTCVIDALSGLYFVCDFTAKGEKLGQERMIDKVMLEKLNKTLIGLSEEEIKLEEVKIEPTAEELLLLAKEKQKRKEFIKPEELSPLYLRKSQAEASLEQKQ